MDVARALLDGESEDGVHEADDGRVFRGVHQLLLAVAHAGAGIFGKLQVADQLRLQQVHHFGRRLDGGLRLVARGRLLFLHELGVGGVHEPAVVLFRGHHRLDHHAFDDAAHVVERENVVGVHHGQGKAVVGEGHGDHLVLLHHALRNQPQHAGVKIHLAQVDVLNAHLLAGQLDPLGEHGGQRQSHFGILQQQLLKIFLLQHGAGGGLGAGHGGGARLAGEQ